VAQTIELPAWAKDHLIVVIGIDDNNDGSIPTDQPHYSTVYASFGERRSDFIHHDSEGDVLDTVERLTQVVREQCPATVIMYSSSVHFGPDDRPRRRRGARHD
jgi:hypothetical protein